MLCHCHHLRFWLSIHASKFVEDVGNLWMVTFDALLSVHADRAMAIK
jgi:hypothetical protein